MISNVLKLGGAGHEHKYCCLALSQNGDGRLNTSTHTLSHGGRRACGGMDLKRSTRAQPPRRTHDVGMWSPTPRCCTPVWALGRWRRWGRCIGSLDVGPAPGRARTQCARRSIRSSCWLGRIAYTLVPPPPWRPSTTWRDALADVGLRSA